MLLRQQKKEHKLGKCSAIELSHDGKRIIVINLHRLPHGSGKGDATCLSQCNASIGAECTARKHKKALLREIKECLHEINANNEVIIAGDCNQNIGGDKIKKIS